MIALSLRPTSLSLFRWPFHPLPPFGVRTWCTPSRQRDKGIGYRASPSIGMPEDASEEPEYHHTFQKTGLGSRQDLWPRFMPPVVRCWTRSSYWASRPSWSTNSLGVRCAQRPCLFPGGVLMLRIVVRPKFSSPRVPHFVMRDGM